MAHTSPMHVAIPTAPGPFTWDDFIALDDEDRRELVDGELVEIEMPSYVHERIVALLVGYLHAWITAADGRGVVLGSGYKVRVDDKRGAMPDVQLFRADNLPRGQPQGLERGRPDLAIEVVSPSSVTFDRVKKLAWYASIGVPEYWIVDAEHRTCERLVLGGARYTIADALEGDETFAPSSFEGLAIPLGVLWRVVDELGDG